MEIQKIPSKLFIFSSIDLKDEIEEVSKFVIVPIKCVLNGKIETHEGFWSSSLQFDRDTSIEEHSQ